MRTLKPYISSSFADLQGYRALALRVLRALPSIDYHFSPIGMEDYGASAKRPADRCTLDIAEADFVILILGFSAGSLDLGSISDQRSVTYVLKEIKEAINNSKPILAFCLPEGAIVSAAKPKERIEQEASESIQKIRDILAEAGFLFATVKSPEEFEEKLVESIFQEFIKEDYISFKRHYMGFFERIGEWMTTVKTNAPLPRYTTNIFMQRMCLVQGSLCSGKTQLLAYLKWEMSLGQFPVLAKIIEWQIDHGRYGSAILPANDTFLVELVRVGGLKKIDFEIAITECMRKARGKTLVLLIDDLDSYLFGPDRSNSAPHASEKDLCEHHQAHQHDSVVRFVRVASAFNTLYEIVQRGAFVVATTTLPVDLFVHMLRRTRRVCEAVSESLFPLDYREFEEFVKTIERKYAVNDEFVADYPKGLPLAHRILLDAGIRGDALDRAQLIHALDSKLTLIRIVTIMLKQRCNPASPTDTPLDGETGEIGSPWRLLNLASAVSTLEDSELRHVEVSHFAEIIRSARETLEPLMEMVIFALDETVDASRARKLAEYSRWVLSFYSISPIPLENLKAHLLDVYSIVCSEGKIGSNDCQSEKFVSRLIVEFQRIGILHRLEIPNNNGVRMPYVHSSVFTRCVARFCGGNGLKKTAVIHKRQVKPSLKIFGKKLLHFEPRTPMKVPGHLEQRLRHEEKIVAVLAYATALIQEDVAAEVNLCFRAAWGLYICELGGWRNLYLRMGDIHQGWRVTCDMHDWVEYVIAQREDLRRSADFCRFAAQAICDRAGYVRLLDDYDFALFLYGRARSLNELAEKSGSHAEVCSKVAEVIDGGTKCCYFVRNPLEDFPHIGHGFNQNAQYPWNAPRGKLRSRIEHILKGLKSTFVRLKSGLELHSFIKILADHAVLEKLLGALRIALFADICLCSIDHTRQEGKKSASPTAHNSTPNGLFAFTRKRLKSELDRSWPQGLFSSKDVQLLKLLATPHPFVEGGRLAAVTAELSDIMGRADADLPGKTKKYRDLRFVNQKTREDRYLGFHPARLIAFLLRSYPTLLGFEEEPRMRYFDVAESNRAIRMARTYGLADILLCLLRLRAASHRASGNHLYALLDYLTFLFGWPAIPAADDSEHGYLTPRYIFPLSSPDSIIRWVMESRGYISRIPSTAERMLAFVRAGEFWEIDVLEAWRGAESGHSCAISEYVKDALLQDDRFRALQSPNLSDAERERICGQLEIEHTRVMGFLDERFQDLKSMPPNSESEPSPSVSAAMPAKTVRSATPQKGQATGNARRKAADRSEVNIRTSKPRKR